MLFPPSLGLPNRDSPSGRGWETVPGDLIDPTARIVPDGLVNRERLEPPDPLRVDRSRPSP